MDLKFSVSGRISKPVGEVFDAVVDPAKLSEYFTTGGATGRLEPGAAVTWDFHDFPGAFPVQVIKVDTNKRIVLQWDGAENAVEADAVGNRRTTVTMNFEALGDGRTLVSIAEHGWSQTPEGIKASYGNCEGWTGMLCALKMWIEHGIHMRQGFYR